MESLFEEKIAPDDGTVTEPRLKKVGVDADEASDRTISHESELKSGLVNVICGPQHFEMIKLIGEGAFGKVILVKNKINQSLYAMKVISKKHLKRQNNIQVIYNSLFIFIQSENYTHSCMTAYSCST